MVKHAQWFQKDKPQAVKIVEADFFSADLVMGVRHG
jgi:hypothetical protein